MKFRFIGNNRTLLGILVLCIVVRLFAGFVVVPKHYPQKFDGSRGDGYLQIGQNLVKGNGYVVWGPKTIRRPPVYPFFIASVLYISGADNIQVVRIIQILFDVITCIFIYLISYHIWKKKGVALLSSFIWVFYYPAVQNNVFFNADSLYTMIMIIFIYCIIKLIRSFNIKVCILAGVLCAISVLCKPVTTYLPIFFVIFLFWSLRNDFKKWFILSTLFCLSFLLVVAPWTIRNYKVSQNIFISSPDLGMLLWESTKWDFDWFGQDNRGPGDLRKIRIEKEIEVFGKINRNRAIPQKYFLNEGLNDIKKEPLKFLYLCIKRSITLWYYEFGARKTILNFFLQLPLIILAILGLRKIRGKKIFNIFIFIILYFQLVHTIIPIVTIRYILPIMPIVIILVSITLHEYFSYIKVKFGFHTKKSIHIL